MATIKPNDFPQAPLPLQGDEELYSQTLGVNSKFTVQDIWNGVTQTNLTVNSGDTIINNDIINISGGTNMVSGGTINVASGSTLISGSTSIVTDNGDGTYTHNDGKVPSTTVIIKPQDYDTSENLTGELWIDSKPIYRKVIQLAQWTNVTDVTGQVLLGSGQTFDSVVRLDFFADEDSGNQLRYMNIGSGTTWQGAGVALYDGSDSYITWEDIYDSTQVTTLQPTVYIIFEYTKP